MNPGIPRWPAAIRALTLGLYLLLPAATAAAPARAPVSPFPGRLTTDSTSRSRRHGHPVRNPRPTVVSSPTRALALTVIVVPATAPPLSYPTWLGPAGPNPFTTSTIIRYSCATPSDVSVKVYGVQGELVATLVNRFHQPGEYSLWWDGRTDAGSHIAPGVYFYRMTMGRRRITNKIVYIR